MVSVYTARWNMVWLIMAMSCKQVIGYNGLRGQTGLNTSRQDLKSGAWDDHDEP